MATYILEGRGGGCGIKLRAGGALGTSLSRAASVQAVALSRVLRHVQPRIQAPKCSAARSDDGCDPLERQTLPWRSCNRLPSGSWNIAAKPQGLCSTSGGSNLTPRDFSVSNTVRQSSVSIVYVAGMTPSTGLALVGVPGHRTSSKS